MNSLKTMIAGLAIGLSAFGAMAQTSATGSTSTPSASSSTTTPEKSAFTNELFADASSRTSTLNGQDGLKLNVGVDLQFRYTANFNDTPTSDDFEGGFSNQMTRLRLDGDVAENWGFNVSAAFRDPQGSDFTLENAYARHSLGGGTNVRFGQFQTAFLHEVNVDDRYQLGAGTSIVSNVFGQGYSQGLEFSQDLGNFNLTGSFSDGLNSANTDFVDPSESDYALTLRGEYLLFGDKAKLNQFTSAPGSGSSLLAGGALSYEDGMSEDLGYTADLTYQNNGWGAYGAVVGRNTDDGINDFNDWAFQAQGSYRFTEKDEIFTRWESIYADSARSFNGDDFNFVSVGYNRYLVGQAARLTLQGVYALDRTDGLSSMGGFGSSGLLGSSEEGEIAFVAQVQISF